jgi:hypothetical protein
MCDRGAILLAQDKFAAIVEADVKMRIGPEIDHLAQAPGQEAISFGGQFRMFRSQGQRDPARGGFIRMGLHKLA